MTPRPTGYETNPHRLTPDEWRTLCRDALASANIREAAERDRLRALSA